MKLIYFSKHAKISIYTFQIVKLQKDELSIRRIICQLRNCMLLLYTKIDVNYTLFGRVLQFIRLRMSNCYTFDSISFHRAVRFDDLIDFVGKTFLILWFWSKFSIKLNNYRKEKNYMQFNTIVKCISVHINSVHIFFRFWWICQTKTTNNFFFFQI